MPKATQCLGNPVHTRTRSVCPATLPEAASPGLRKELLEHKTALSEGWSQLGSLCHPARFRPDPRGLLRLCGFGEVTVDKSWKVFDVGKSGQNLHGLCGRKTTFSPGNNRFQEARYPETDLCTRPGVTCLHFLGLSAFICKVELVIAGNFSGGKEELESPVPLSVRGNDIPE